MMGAGGTNLWFNAGATNYFEVNLTNAASFLNGPTNALYDRELVTLEFIQDATGNRTILYNTGQSSGNIVPTTCDLASTSPPTPVTTTSCCCATTWLTRTGSSWATTGGRTHEKAEGKRRKKEEG